MKSLVGSFLVLAITWPGLAQQWTPTLLVPRDGKIEPLDLARLAIEVRIVGCVAETSVTMTFSNPNPRVAEGDLLFPLPDGATVSGYALDVQGKMVDGVSVEKRHASDVFAQEESRGVDPGLVEWDNGNCFRTRVFPIPALGSRTVRVQYVSELVDEAGGLCYRLPLRVNRPVAEVSLRIDVVRPAAAPTIRQSALPIPQFSKSRDDFHAESKIEHAVLDKDLLVGLTDVEKQDALVEWTDDGVYFALQDLPAVPQPERIVPPKHVVIYWDASGSGEITDHRREIGLVKALLAAWTAADDGPSRLEVDLVLVRNAQSPPRRFTITEKGAEQLIAALENVAYDGGAQLGAIAPLAGANPDLALLFSNGVTTFGLDNPPQLGTPLHVISSDVRADSAWLRHLARSNRGRYFDLLLLDDAAVVAGVQRPPLSLLSATVDDGGASELLPAAPWAVDGHCLLVGRLDGPQAHVTLRYGCGLVGQVSPVRTFAINRTKAVSGQLLRTLWAQKKLEELVVFPKRNEEQIAALGARYGLVTPFTSLMVLESLEQYVQHHIEPPATLPELRAAYQRRIAEEKRRADEEKRRAGTTPQQAGDDRHNKIEEVVRLWDARVKWWETDFSRPKPPVGPAYVMGGGQGAGMGGGMASGGMGMGGMGAGMGSSGMSRGMGGFGGMGGGMGGMGGGMDMGGSTRAPAGRGGISGTGMGMGMMGGMGGAGSNGAAAAPPAPPVTNYSISPVNARRGPPIVLSGWDPAAPYLAQLRAAPISKAFAVYMKNRAQYRSSPAFFMNCADYFFSQRDPNLAIQILSNVAELGLYDSRLPRMLGLRLAQMGALDLAVLTLEDVLRMRPDDPQAYRDLALVLGQRADAAAKALDAANPGLKTPRAMSARLPGTAGERFRLTAEHDRIAAIQFVRGGGAAVAAIRSDYQRAVDLLTEVVVRRWEQQRFANIELPVLMELNRILVRARAYGVEAADLDPRLIKPLDVDVRIVVTSISGGNGIRLEVAEPSGERAEAAHPQTAIGGLIGHPSAAEGPVEYLLHKAIRGTYVVRANESANANNWYGPMTLQVDMYTHFGRENEQCRSLTVQLKNSRQTMKLGQLKF